MTLIIPTKLDEQQIREFRFLYYQHYGIKLNQEEVQEKGVQFLQFMTFIIQDNEKFLEKEKPIEK